MWYVVIFLAIAIIISIIPDFGMKSKIKKEIDEQSKLKNLINANVKTRSKQYINSEFTKAINIDEVNNKVQLFSIIGNTHKEYDFDDIVQSEVIIDNNSIVKVDRGKQITGALIGGVLAGGIGAIIGGLSSGQSTKEKIKSIDLKLTLNDINNSIFKINFLPISNKGFVKDSPQVRNALTAIEKWQGDFAVIIKQQKNIASN